MAASSNRPGSEDRPGVRIGPMVFVPEFSTSPNDPWAHRKGEPRLFTLMWSIYLLVGAMGTIFATRTIGPPTPSAYRVGCLAMVTVVAVGGTILWPVVRLSQRSPSRPARATLVDLAVILLPAQSVVWPMPMLTRWPWDVTAAMALVVTGWITLVGAVVARATARPPGLGRVATMVVICAAVLGGPTLGVVGASQGWWSPESGLLASPITGPWALAETPQNLRPRMTPWEWSWAAAPGVGAALMWASVAAAARRGRARGSGC
jgi:hypothetical protein